VKSNVQRARERQAAKCSHGRALEIAISTLRLQLHNLRRDLRTAKGEEQKARINANIIALDAIAKQREAELRDAIAADEAEKASA
jgi:hypothetical protein